MILEKIVLPYSMPWKDSLEVTYDECHGVYILVYTGKIFQSIQMSSVVCVHSSQLVEHCVTNAYTS